MKFCPRCELTLEITKFNKNKSRNDGLQPYCRRCTRIRDKSLYNKSDTRKKNIRNTKSRMKVAAREFVIQYLLTHPCIICNESDIVVLEFDHISNKSGNVSDMIQSGKSIKSIKLEIDKCQVMCANCHKRKTAKQFDWNKFKS